MYNSATILVVTCICEKWYIMLYHLIFLLNFVGSKCFVCYMYSFVRKLTRMKWYFMNLILFHYGFYWNFTACWYVNSEFTTVSVSHNICRQYYCMCCIVMFSDFSPENAKDCNQETLFSQHLLVCALQEMGSIILGLGTTASNLLTDQSLSKTCSL
jgi:hypothetical protein